MMRLLWTLALLAALPLFAGAEKGTGTDPDRLSWLPSDYLQKGFRNAPWIHDPFFPDEGEYKLSGVISNEMAFINGRWLRIGESIGGFKVKSISPRGVTLNRRGEVVVLHMENP